MAPAFVCLSIYLSICLPACLPELLSANSAVHVFRNLLLFVSIFVIRLCLQNVMHSITLKENEHQHNTLEAICVFFSSLCRSPHPHPHPNYHHHHHRHQSCLCVVFVGVIQSKYGFQNVVHYDLWALFYTTPQMLHRLAAASLWSQWFCA